MIAMQFEVTDKTAITLTSEFYEVLSEGYPVDAALAEARKSIYAAGNDIEWGTPVLYMRAQDGRLFDITNAEGGVRSAELLTVVKVETPVVTIPVAKPEADYAAIFAQMQARLEEQDRKLGEYQKPAEPTRQPTPKSLSVWQKIGIEMVNIPAGEFLYGEDKQKLTLPEFWIAKTPVTNQQYKAFVDATGHEAPQHWQDGKIPLGKENHPVTDVSWNDAKKFCDWAKLRLPSEQQWEKAARGSDGREYPWGNQEPDRTLCNFNGNVGDTTPVGNYAKGASPYGLFDMAGNVWEWCEDWSDSFQIDRVMRGGSFRYYDNSLRCAFRLRYNPRARGDYLGFSVVSPGS